MNKTYDIQEIKNGPPSTPRNFNIINTASGIKLYWDIPSSTSGKSITYEVYRSTSASGTFVLISTTSSTYYIFNSGSDTTYYYKIRAKSTLGLSSFTSTLKGKYLLH